MIALCLLLAPLLQEPAPTLVVADDGNHTLDCELYDVATVTGHDRVLFLENRLHLELEERPPSSARLRLVLDDLDRERVVVERATDRVISYLRTRLTPPLDERLGLLQSVGGGRILLHGTPAQHRWVRERLSSFTASGEPLFVHATIYRLSEGSLERAGIERRGRVVSKVHGDALRERLSDLAPEEPTVVPPVVVQAFQNATLSMLREIAYVQDYERIVLAENVIMDPVVGTVQDGVSLDLVACPIDAGRFALEVELIHSDVLEPMPTFTTTFGVGEPEVTVQLPEVHRTTLDGEFELGPGEVLVIASERPTEETALQAHFWDRRDTLLLLALGPRSERRVPEVLDAK